MNFYVWFGNLSVSGGNMCRFVGLNHMSVWRPGLEAGFHVCNAYCISANTSDTSSLIAPTATRQRRAMRLS